MVLSFIFILVSFHCPGAILLNGLSSPDAPARYLRKRDFRAKGAKEFEESANDRARGG